MRRILSNTNSYKNENLYDDFNDEMIEEPDLYDGLVEKNLLDDVVTTDEDEFNADEYNDINSDSYDDTEETTQKPKVKNSDSLLNVLRDELKLKEFERGYLKFKYRGEIYDGVPMVEINPGKFVFKIDDKMKSILLAEIKVM